MTAGENAARRAAGLPPWPPGYDSDTVYVVIKGRRTQVLTDGTAVVDYGPGGRRQVCVVPGEPDVFVVPELAATALALCPPR